MASLLEMVSQSEPQMDGPRLEEFIKMVYGERAIGPAGQIDSEIVEETAAFFSGNLRHSDPSRHREILRTTMADRPIYAKVTEKLSEIEDSELSESEQLTHLLMVVVDAVDSLEKRMAAAETEKAEPTNSGYTTSDLTEEMKYEARQRVIMKVREDLLRNIRMRF